MTNNLNDRRGRCSDIPADQLDSPAEGCQSPRPLCDDKNPCTNGRCLLPRIFISLEVHSYHPNCADPAPRCDSIDGHCKFQSDFDFHQGCPTPPPLCDDNNLCTNDSAFCRGHGLGWECSNLPNVCNAGTRCDATDGQCKSPSNLDLHQACPSPPPVCDDNNLCTNDSAFCRGHGLGWECSNSPKVCNAGTRCDATDGQCKSPSNLDLHQGCPSPPPVCDDNNLCTSDFCFLQRTWLRLGV